MITAVIFDFDGVIADTEAVHYKVFQEVLADWGIQYSWKDYVEHYMGFDDRDAFRQAFSRAGKTIDSGMLGQLIRRKAEVFEERAMRNGIMVLPGVVNLVHTLEKVVPLGICSGALKSDIQPILESAGLASSFPVRVTAEDVQSGKPNPEGYRRAIRLLSEHAGRALAPECGWAVEDTPDGIQSAQAAGLNVLAVANSYPVEMLQEADRVVSSLESVHVVQLNEWLERQ